MKLFDTVLMDGVRRTADGYLVARARVARTGIQLYDGASVGKPELRVVRVYRPEEEVFNKDTLSSYAFRPMTNDHPNTAVDASNWRQHAVGHTGGEVARDGEMVVVPLVLMDAGAIEDYEKGKRELSMGYDAEIVFESGLTPDGQPYDAIQRGMRMNHLALVDRARGGAALRIGDDNPNKEEPPMSDKMKTVLVDGLSVETTEAGAQAIAKLQGDIQARDAAATTAATAHTTAIAAKDAALAAKDAEIDALKAKVLTDAQLDARVQARADLIAAATRIADGDYTGKSEADIKRLACVAKLGDAALKDKPQAYVDARFDILLEEASKSTPARQALGDRNRNVNDRDDDGQAAYDARVRDAWRNTNGNTNQGAR